MNTDEATDKALIKKSVFISVFVISVHQWKEKKP